MTQTPYILWAVLATGGGIGACIGWIRCTRLLSSARDLASERQIALRVAKADISRWRDLANAWARGVLELNGQLYDIKTRRKASAKHARQAQLSQQRAKVLEQASKLVAPKVDRIAA